MSRSIRDGQQRHLTTKTFQCQEALETVNKDIQRPDEGLLSYRLVDVVHKCGENLNAVQSGQPFQNVAVTSQKLDGSYTVD